MSSKAQEIFEKAKESPREFNGKSCIKDDDTYNTSFYLSHEHIHAAALFLIQQSLGISLTEAAKSYHIDGVSYNAGNNDIKEFFGEILNNALKHVKEKKKPSFLIIEESAHFVLLALVPNLQSNKVSLVYLNSMPESCIEYQNNKIAKAGKDFAQKILKYFINKDKSLEFEYKDLSIDQQYDNCCGLSVASNIANIAKNHVNIRQDTLFFGKDNYDKESYYKTLGKEFFQFLDQEKINFHTTPIRSRRVQPKVYHTQSWHQKITGYLKQFLDMITIKTNNFIKTLESNIKVLVKSLLCSVKYPENSNVSYKSKTTDVPQSATSPEHKNNLYYNNPQCSNHNPEKKCDKMRKRTRTTMVVKDGIAFTPLK